MNKIFIRKLLKIILGLLITSLLGFVLLLCFYIYMIYGIHPSDEGNRQISCEYNSQNQLIKVEVTTIIDGKRIVTQGKASECNQQFKP